MASDPSIPVNGNYATHSAYALNDQSYASHAISSANPTPVDYSGAPPPPTTATSEGNGGKTDIPKDEVGWYFVEQYYTNLGKSPEKLYLFYNKQSQFVSGDEAQKVPVSVGQKAINERIKELGFQDARVRVSNVDSQGSGANIVIQTFVLAEQTNGYFVLNDIFRYIVDEEDGPLDDAQNAGSGAYEETAPTDIPAVPHELTNALDVGVQEMDAASVDQSPEKPTSDKAPATDAPTTTDINGGEVSMASEATLAENAPEVVHSEEATASIAQTPEAVDDGANEVDAEPDKIKVPETAPISATPSPVPTQPAVATPASKPAVPKSWAALAAGANRTTVVAAPAVPAATSTSVSTASGRAMPPPLTQPLTAPASASQSHEPESPVTPQSGSEWQTAGHDHGKRQARPQSMSGTNEENYKGYIKHVSEHVDLQALKSALAKSAEISYIDINRQKNCAFVDFASPAAYRAAVAANPHDVDGEQMYVEERRIRTQGYTGTYGPNRGGAGRGRGGSDNRGGGQNRGAFPREGARGGFASRGRGGNGNARGRGVSSVA